MTKDFMHRLNLFAMQGYALQQEGCKHWILTRPFVKKEVKRLLRTWQSQPAGRLQQALQLGAAIIGAGYQRAKCLQEEPLCRVLVVGRSPSICTHSTFLPSLVELFGTPSSEGVLTENGTTC